MHAPDTTLNRRRALRAALVGFLGAILAAACAAPHASAAAQRYASPNGAGTRLQLSQLLRDQARGRSVKDRR